MNQEIEPTGAEPIPEAGSPIEAARAIYSDYVTLMNSKDGERDRKQTEEMLAQEDSPEKAAHRYAKLCADLGRPERAVGFLEHSDLSETERLALVAKAEDHAAANALALAIQASEKSDNDRVQRAIKISATFQSGMHRDNARTLKKGVEASTQDRAA